MRTYIPALVTVTWGEITFRALADGDSISVAMDEDATTTSSGAQGDVAVTVNATRTAKVTIVLQQVSLTNAQLGPLVASNRPRDAPLIIKPFTIKDASNPDQGAFVFGKDAWIEKAPDFKRGKEHGNAEWMFRIAECENFSGGHES